MRPAAYVPSSKPVDELLRQMQLQRTHVDWSSSTSTAAR